MSHDIQVNVMPEILHLAVAQSHTLSTTSATIAALERTVQKARTQSIDLILFPEAYLGGYPRTATFGAAVGARNESGREQFLHYFKDAIDLGDTPEGAGKKWVDRELELPEKGIRGDGTREELERIARETGVFIVTGLVERSGGTLYCGVVYICPRLGIMGKRRKVMPTGSERLIWGQGQPSSLRAITTIIRGVKLTLASAICWENYMPLLRQSLYSQNVNLYLAPTADGRDTWLPLMQTIACEGRCVVLSANQCMTKSNLPSWIMEKNNDGAVADDGHSTNGNMFAPRLRRKSTIVEDENEIALPSWVPAHGSRIGGGRSTNGSPTAPRLRRKSTIIDDGNEIVLPSPKQEKVLEETSDGKRDPSELVSRGGSCIVSPYGKALAGPLWDDENGLLTVDVDFEDCLRGRLDLDVGGSYSRNDSFKLTVEGLDLNPPP